MGNIQNGSAQATLEYPKHAFQPVDLVTFVELDGFSDDWKDLGLSDDDLMALQIMIMAGPKASPVIPGTGGLRKMRFAPAAWRKGKRGAMRVCYVYLEEWAAVLLVVAYSKKEKSTLSQADRKAYRQLIQRIEKEFASRTIR
jgi:hypothetical protein